MNRISSKSRFTLNVNFTSTPKINKFRSKLPRPPHCPECVLLENMQHGNRCGPPPPPQPKADDVESSKKSSLVLLSLNDYLRRLLQKKSTSESSASKRASVVAAGKKQPIELMVSRKHSLKEQSRHKRRVGGVVRRTAGRHRHESLRGKNMPNRSSPIDFGRFCDLKFNETNNYNISGVAASNGFNQFGQLKVWYV